MDFSNISILVIGDVMLDHYITGSISRISPEAPVPVVNKEQAWTVPGGAANVARCLSRLGCDARLAGLAGFDSAGETLIREVDAEGIKNHICRVNRPTSCKTRIMARGQQLLRVDEEVSRPPDLEEITILRKHIENSMPGCKAVILSDYAKGVLLTSKSGACICRDAIQQAKDLSIPVLVDPKSADWQRYAGAQCVTPNMSEFIKICEILPDQDDNLKKNDKNRFALAQDICHKFSIQNMLLTRGSKGMDLYEAGEKPLHIHAAAREVADVSGAGDTVIATLAACIAKGFSWAKSAFIANAAAGVAVTKLGAAPVSLAELNNALREGEDNPKLYTWEAIREKIKEWRRQDQSIVFTNGCFDLLHPGHIALLRKSAEFGDRLIVGLNSDASVRRLKGPTRPVQNEQSRALLLSALQVVDAIVLFEEDTPELLIRNITPDYLVKGADYKPDEIVGAEYVKSMGGHVRTVSLVDGCSTTGLVRKMREN